MRFDEYISSLSFSIWQPDAERAADRRLVVPRRSGDDAKLVELPRAAVDVLNVAVPPGLDSLYEMVAPQCRMTRMSTFAVGTIINRAVAEMSPGHSYVNIGTWAGFSLWAGMAGNPGKRCVGVDDFSLFGGPREALHEWFDRLHSPNHEFHEMDYRDYFARVHEGPIGVYFYDGAHSYEHQLLGLQTAEKFFGDECIVVVDDTNWVEPYEATYDFIAASEREYTVMLDQQTAGNEHPTFWNGLLILRTSARARSATPPQGRHKPWQGVAKQYDPVKLEPDVPLVSLVLRNSRSSAARLEAAGEEALALQWPSTEIVVADERAGGSQALAAAVDATHGDYVALVDTEDRLLPSAVGIGLAFPNTAEFTRNPTDALLQRLERTLALIKKASAVVPRGSSFALANGRLPVPRIDNGREVAPFLDEAGEGDGRSPGDDVAFERLHRLRSSGTAFLVVGWRSFDWLVQFPRFREELEARATRVLEHEDVVVFDLRYG